MRYKDNIFINNNKPVICGNNTTGLQLSTKVVSVMQCIFGYLVQRNWRLLAFIPLMRHSHLNSHSNESVS